MLPRALYPVLHYRDDATTIRMAELCSRTGCAGVWLINMSGPSQPVRRLRDPLVRDVPGLWVGLNALDLPPGTAVTAAVEAGFDGVWVDNPGLHTTAPAPGDVAAMAHAFATAQQIAPAFRCWASVAFKTQPVEPDPVGQACAAAAHGWTPTTSGAATGTAPAVSHVATLRAGLAPSVRLAVASGLTVENAPAFWPHVDDWFVATGISATFHTLDPVRLTQLQHLLGRGPDGRP